MYGLSHAGNFSNDKLKQNLSKFGYDPATITPGLWQHQICTLEFSLVVDEFGVKYEWQSDITHLLYSLKTIFKISEDCDCKL